MVIRGKVYRVKSSLRFSLFVALVLVVFVMGFNSFIGMNNAASMTETEYVRVTVVSGDTLWGLADKYMPDNIDLRNGVAIISELNNTSASKITPGQVLLIPIE